MPKVTVPEFLALAKTHPVFDVRSPGEYAAGRLRRSVNIPLDTLQAGLNKLKKDKPVITCCASGMRSSAARSILASKGFTVYNGGSWLNLKKYDA